MTSMSTYLNPWLPFLLYRDRGPAWILMAFTVLLHKYIIAMEQEKNGVKTGKKQLKITAKHFPRADSQYVVLPEIKLSGKWLQEAGFHCGASVMVSYEKNKITVTAHEENREEK